MHLVVLAVILTLGIKDSGPVVGFEVILGVDIDLHLDESRRLADRVSGDSLGRESSSDDLSDSRWAPLDNFTGLQVELGTKKGVCDGSTADLSERKGLSDGRALITESENGSLFVDSDADGKSTGNTRSGTTWLGEVRDGDAGAVFILGRQDFGHAQRRLAGSLKIEHSDGNRVMIGLKRGACELMDAWANKQNSPLEVTLHTYRGLERRAGEGRSGSNKSGKDGELHFYN